MSVDSLGQEFGQSLMKRACLCFIMLVKLRSWEDPSSRALNYLIMYPHSCLVVDDGTSVGLLARIPTCGLCVG